MWIRDLSKLVSGKRCIIIGSAPNPVFPDKIEEDDVIISIKASGYVANKAGIVPDVTFLGDWAVHDNLLKLANLSTEMLIYAHEDNTWRESIVDLCGKYRFKYNKVYAVQTDHLPTFYCSDLFQDCISNNPISYGVGVIIMCQNLGAKDVVLVGINPGSKGRSYDSPRPLYEGHKESDIEVIVALQKGLGNMFTYDKEVANKLSIGYLNV